MNLPISWLKEFVRFNLSPSKVAEIFTKGGFEVEEIIFKGKNLDKVIVGQIKSIAGHEAADRLSICQVDVGKNKLLNIVCGAKNIEPGQKVPVALVGTTLPNGLKIERRKIRGVYSEGMLCAEDELGLGDDHSGIVILDKKSKIGRNLGEILKIDDYVLDISLTPNRPDCYSVIGLAREFAALARLKFNSPKIKLREDGQFRVAREISAEVDDYNLCPRYAARVVKGVKVGPSPQWLQSRLRLSGLKPVNNIVDAANYVFLEMGQPLHTFDLHKVSGNKIFVRLAGRKDKKFISLDGEQRNLSPEMLVISDKDKPIAIAGIIGGKNSEITSMTSDVLIESAIFNPASIRKSRQRLGMATEASSRFEKGIYWELPVKAVDRAAELISEVSGGRVAKGRIVKQKKNKIIVSRKPIKVKFSYLNRLIGRNFKPREVKNSLEQLGFNCKLEGQDSFTVIVPEYRTDVFLPADIAEEVGRLYGWEKIIPQPIYAELKPAKLSKEKFLFRKVSSILTGLGLVEVINYSSYGKREIDKFGLPEADHYRILNPMNPDQEYMRISLLPRLHANLLQQFQNYSQVEIFEFGRIFLRGTSKSPLEGEELAVLVYKKGDQRGNKSLARAKGIVSALVSAINPRNELLFGADADDDSGYITVNQVRVGKIGNLFQDLDKLKNPPAYFVLDIKKMLKAMPEQVIFRAKPMFPAVEHDLTFVVSAELDYNEIISTVKKISNLIADIKGKDLYFSNESKVFATFRIKFQANDHTLSQKEINWLREKIISRLREKFNMELKQ